MTSFKISQFPESSHYTQSYPKCFLFTPEKRKSVEHRLFGENYAGHGSKKVSLCLKGYKELPRGIDQSRSI